MTSQIDRRTSTHMNLTKPQKLALRYYLAIETKTNRIGRFQTRFKSPDPRTLENLGFEGLKLIEVVGFNYGPIIKLTESGRAMAQALEAEATVQA